MRIFLIVLFLFFIRNTAFSQTQQPVRTGKRVLMPSDTVKVDTVKGHLNKDTGARMSSQDTSGKQIIVRDTTGEAPELNYLSPKVYLIDTVMVRGTKFLDNQLLVNISHLRIGAKVRIPGDEKLSGAMKSLWQQGLFENVSMEAKVRGTGVILTLVLEERPRLGKIELRGIKKGANEDITKKLKDIESRVVTDNVLNNIERVVKKYFNDKGYLNTTISFSQRKDSVMQNKVTLVADITRNKKARVNKIVITGNQAISTKKIRKFLKNTKQRAWYKLLGSKKFLLNKYEEDDKQALLNKFRNRGYRDIRIVSDSISHDPNGNVTLYLNLSQGPKYYFGDVTWSGNAKYTAEQLGRVLGVKKGDIYDQEKLEKRLQGSQNGDDVSSLYTDNGYLFSQIVPTEVGVRGDTVDLEMKVFEGAQADYNRITVKGNTRTNDKVVLRQIATLPGEKFSKTEVVGTTRELSQLGFFDESKLNPAVHPNQDDGTVDIEYNVEEKPSDQVELSGGFGGGRIVGSLGLTFNNFSIQKLFKGNWEGLLPQGDGQKISIKASANGKQYQQYNLSFIEPWLGGHKPISFGFNLAMSSLSYTAGYAKSDPKYQGANIYSASISLGKRLTWPDNLFQIQYALSFAKYDLKNFPGFIYNTGASYNLSLTQTISRNSIDQPIYPTSGSNIRFSIEVTPPYSSFTHRDYTNGGGLSPAVLYRFTEYHKWKFEASYFIKLYGKLVLNTSARFGFIGYYQPGIGVPQLNRFLLGGDGLQGFNFLQSTEIIGLRGYQNYSILPPGGNSSAGSPIYDKFTMELRHPITATPSATIYGLFFLEGGNTWNHFSDYSPFNIKRSAGIGARIYLPIFGLLGLDYGYGFDPIVGNPSANRGQFHFTINKGLDGF